MAKWIVVLMLLGIADAVTREYFIAAQDILWNYIPGGGQFKDNDALLFAKPWTTQAADRIGPVYKKSAYFQYTDDTFTVEVPKNPELGLIGPFIRGETGDDIVIHFFNNASGNYSMHPHGVFYQKKFEGALYLDGTSGVDKMDDSVPKGGKVTVVWKVTENNSPTSSDPNCITWVYHSHTDAVRDPSTGLIGILATCKKGTLDNNNRRKDVDVDLPVLVFNWDENLSWFIDDNIQTFCGDPDRCRQLQAAADPDFVNSNKRNSINGLQFASLQGLQACVNDRVVIYSVGFGNEIDVHALHFHGQDLFFQHTRGDTLSVYTATFITAETTPKVAGDWLVTDMVDNFEKSGISAIFSVNNCYQPGSYKKPRPSSRPRYTRRYFLSVDEIQWNYAPSGKDLRTGQSLFTSSSSSSNSTMVQGYPVSKGLSNYPYTEGKNFDQPSTQPSSAPYASSQPNSGPSPMRLTYTKAKFVQYTSDTFYQQVKPSPGHLGLQGPVLRVELGDRLELTLRNTIPFPVSFLPHGLRYDPSEEFVASAVRGGIINQNEVHTYTFDVPLDLLEESSTPCKNFIYTSAYDIEKDQSTGLFGTILVCKEGYLSSREEKPKEVFLLLSTIDENKSLYANSSWGVPDLKFGINGYIFGNLPPLDFNLNDKIVWYVMCVGSPLDVHTITFDGNTFDENGKTRDGRYLAPGLTATLVMQPDNSGRWMLFSHSNLARENGMFAFYTVRDATNNYGAKPSNYPGKVRDFFVAADELLWDYAPLPRSIVTGQDLFDPNTEGHIFVRNDNLFIGKVHKKAVFREYTDGTFQVLKPVENRDLLGPVITAEVGDTVRVTFRNNAFRPYSIHAHGVKTRQRNSGVNYGDAFGVAPNSVYQYIWEIPERSGPGEKDPNCIPWVYYSSVDPTKDTNSGLVGALVICRQGTLDSYNRRKDVDRELFTMFTIMNENFSWYLEDNIRMFAPGRLGTDFQNDPAFVESNKKHSINGRIYGNNQNLVMLYNQRVAWYILGVGAEVDLHTVHMHGHTYVQSSYNRRDDTLQIFPGMAESVQLKADDPGTWLFHCHVLDHIAAGMETIYTVFKPMTPGSSKSY